MPSVLAETPRKMLPPPMTMPTSTPSSMTSRTSWAICCSVLGEMPYFPSPISASPDSLRRMRLNRGALEVGAVTGGGSYLARSGWSRRAEHHQFGPTQGMAESALDLDFASCAQGPDAVAQQSLRDDVNVVEVRDRGHAQAFAPSQADLLRNVANGGRDLCNNDPVQIGEGRGAGQKQHRSPAGGLGQRRPS